MMMMIKKWNGKDLKALEKESLLIERLISPSKAAWLIYPKEVNEDLEIILFKLRDEQRNS